MPVLEIRSRQWNFPDLCLNDDPIVTHADVLETLPSVEGVDDEKQRPLSVNRAQFVCATCGIELEPSLVPAH